MAKLLPMRVTGESSKVLPGPLQEPGLLETCSSGTIHIQLQHAQVRIEGARIRLYCGCSSSACSDEPLPSNTQIWIAPGVTDLHRGFMSLSALVQSKLEQSPMSVQVLVYGDGLCLFAKRL